MKKRSRLLFLSLEEFQHKIQNQEFVEWEMVYEGRYYGTLKSELERLRNNIKSLFLILM